MTNHFNVKTIDAAIDLLIWKIEIMFFNLMPMMLVYDLFVVIKVLILLLTETRNIRIIYHVIVHVILVCVTIVRNPLPVTGTEDVWMADLLDLINSIHTNIHHVIVIINPRIAMNLEGVQLVQIDLLNCP